MLRGPGNIEGKQQSGMLRFMIADLAKDGNILQAARNKAAEILEADPQLASPDHTLLRDHMAKEAKENRFWSNIS
jgi:ATP-dependent DNA helicase RecG